MGVILHAIEQGDQFSRRYSISKTKVMTGFDNSTQNYKRAITLEQRMIWELSPLYAQLDNRIYHPCKFEEIMLNSEGVSRTRNC